MKSYYVLLFGVALLITGCGKSDNSVSVKPTLLGSLRIPYGDLVGASLQDVNRYPERWGAPVSASKTDPYFTVDATVVDWLRKNATSATWKNVFKDANQDQMWYVPVLYESTYWPQLTFGLEKDHGVWITFIHKDEAIFKYSDGTISNSPLPNRTDLFVLYYTPKLTKTFRIVIGN
ncbi:hypothetical protein [Spirosoma areae]